MTQIELLTHEMQHTRKAVCDLTGLSNDEINAMIFDGAYQWLESIGSDAYGVEHLPKTQEFWGFWKQEWHLIDKQYVALMRKYEIGRTREWYLSFHSDTPRNQYLNSTLLSARYHKLVKELAVKR